MNDRLNYYSRYTRIKNPKQIITLYNLIEGLNLDAVISDDLVSRVNQYRTMHMEARARSNVKSSMYKQDRHNTNYIFAKGFSRNNQIPLDIQSLNKSQGSHANPKSNINSNIRRSSSRSSKDLHKQKINNSGVDIKVNTSREGSVDRRSQSRSSKGSRKRDEAYKKYIDEEMENMYVNQGHARNPNIRIQTQMTGQTPEQPSSPIHNINIDLQQQPYPLEDTIQQQQQNEAQPQTHKDRQSENNNKQIKSQFYQSENEEEVGGRVEDMNKNFDDQISEGLVQLNKVDDIRNSSYYNNANQHQHHNQNQPHQQSSQSQKLYRSDISVNMDPNTQQTQNPYQKQHRQKQNALPTQPQTHQTYTNNKYDLKININVDDIIEGRTNSKGKNLGGDADHIGSEEEATRQKKFKNNQRSLFNKHYQQEYTHNIFKNNINQDLQKIDSSQTTFSFIFNRSNNTNQKDNSNNANSNIQPAQKQRKPFKKMMLDKKFVPRVQPNIANDQSNAQNEPVQNNIKPPMPLFKINVDRQANSNSNSEDTPNFKFISKFKPITRAPQQIEPKTNDESTPIPAVPSGPPSPAKKVNFKKAIKKQSSQNKEKSESENKIQAKPQEEKRQLLKAFFDLN